MTYINKEELKDRVHNEALYEDNISKDALVHNLMDSVDNIDVVKLTDEEQRIFLVAMAKEMAVCKKVNKQPGVVDLVAICNNIERKVKNALF